MQAHQLFGFTPPNPPKKYIGFAAVHVIEGDAGFRLMLRPQGSADGTAWSLDLPSSEAVKLASAIIDEALKAASGEDPLLQFFAFAHLPEHLQAISAPFGAQAARIVVTLPRNPERTVALRKLLEAKNYTIHAAIWKG